MPVITMSSVEAQNGFGTLLDKSQREIVSVTHRGRVTALVMSPQVLQDYIDGYLALEAEKKGFASPKETEQFLNSLRNA